MIQDKSMVVSLSISQWSARKHDRKITEEVREAHKTSEDAGRYNKLLAAKKHTEAVAKIAGKARLIHYDNTLPWGDNNERLLPSDNYFTYVREMTQLKDEFDKAVIDFIANYLAVMDDAKQRLNGLFNEKDYPSILELPSKYGFKTTFMTVPDADFRVSLSEGEISKLNEAAREEITNRMTAAVKDTWNRIKDQLMHMKERLADKDAKFKNSLFDNLKDLIDLLPRLNVTGDSNINQICAEMSGIIVSPDAVRTNVNLRNQKAEEVNQVLNKFSDFFA